MTSSVKKSALMFLTLLFVFNCINTKYFIVETEEGDGNEINAEGNPEDDDDDDDEMSEEEEDGDELPDDLELLNDDLEMDDEDTGTEDYRAGWPQQTDDRDNNFLALI